MEKSSLERFNHLLALENFVKPTSFSQVLKLTHHQKSGTKENGTIGALQNSEPVWPTRVKA